MQYEKFCQLRDDLKLDQNQRVKNCIYCDKLGDHDSQNCPQIFFNKRNPILYLRNNQSDPIEERGKNTFDRKDFTCFNPRSDK